MNKNKIEEQSVISTVMTFYDPEGYEFYETVEYNSETGEIRVDGKSEKEIFEESRQVVTELHEEIAKEFKVDKELARDVIEVLTRGFTDYSYDVPKKAERIAVEIADKGLFAGLLEKLKYCEEIQNAFDQLNILDNSYATILEANEA